MTQTMNKQYMYIRMASYKLSQFIVMEKKMFMKFVYHLISTLSHLSYNSAERSTESCKYFA
jgi:hypothetical protein